MKRKLLEDVATLVSPLIPFQSAEDRNSKEDRWIGTLNEEDLETLFDWLSDPTPIAAPIPVESAYISETADRVAYYIGTAGRRLGNDEVRLRLESLLYDPSVRVSALEGLEAFGSRRSISAIRKASKMDRDPTFGKQIAFVLTSLGGEDAIAGLTEMLSTWEGVPSVCGTVRTAIEEAKRR